jgi:hypothetical protein
VNDPPPPPRYRHDCRECRYLGAYRAHDLYSCLHGGRPTVLARFGDAGPDYVSGLALAGLDPILAHAVSILEMGEETEWISAVGPPTDGGLARTCTELVEAWWHARKRAEVWKRAAKQIWTREVPDRVGRHGCAARCVKMQRHGR